MRQAIDQIGVERTDAGRAQILHAGLRHVVRLNAPDRGLHLRVEILDADACPVHPLVGKRGDLVAVDHGGVDLHREFAILRRGDHRLHRLREAVDQVRRQDRRRAAPPVHPAHAQPRGQDVTQQGELLLHRLKVAFHGAQRAGPLGPAGAEPAQPFAERDVQVDRNRHGRVQRGQRFGLEGGAGLGRKDRGRGIGGIAGHAGIEEPEAAEAVDLFHESRMPVFSGRDFARDQVLSQEGARRR